MNAFKKKCFSLHRCSQYVIYNSRENKLPFDLDSFTERWNPTYQISRKNCVDVWSEVKLIRNRLILDVDFESKTKSTRIRHFTDEIW